MGLECGERVASHIEVALLVRPHEVDPLFHSCYRGRGRVETLDAHISVMTLYQIATVSHNSIAILEDTYRELDSGSKYLSSVNRSYDGNTSRILASWYSINTRQPY